MCHTKQLPTMLNVINAFSRRLFFKRSGCRLKDSAADCMCVYVLRGSLVIPEPGTLLHDTYA